MGRNLHWSIILAALFLFLDKSASGWLAGPRAAAPWLWPNQIRICRATPAASAPFGPHARGDNSANLPSFGKRKARP